MRLGLYQCHSPAGDIPAGLAVVATALAQAAQEGVDMLVMPELFLPGYNSVTIEQPGEWPEILEHLSDFCRSQKVALTIGLPEYTGKSVYNSAYVWDRDGVQLARYRKVQLFGPREQALFEPGNELVTFEYEGHRFGLLICYDVEFPEHVRALNRAGARIVLTPTANMMPHINVNLIQVPGRAMENGCTIVYCNYTGSEGDLEYTGHSLIAGPDGYPLANKGLSEGLVLADVPTAELESQIPVSTQLADYRPAKAPS